MNVAVLSSIKFSTYSDTRYAAVFVGLVLGFALWLASLGGMFSVANGVLYDQLASMATPFVQHQSKVLLIEVEPELRDKGDAVWIALQKELLAQGAAQLAYTFMPSSVSRDFYVAASQSGRVIFGRRLMDSPGTVPAAPAMAAVPGAAQGLDLTMAIYALSPSEYGVYRRQAYAFGGHGSDAVDSLEAAAAHGTRAPGSKGERAPFLVNFLDGKSSLPRLSAQRILDGELIPELVKGRSVLIGLSGESQPLYTPLSSSGRSLSELEFHGYALDTLLHEQAIRSLPLWLETLLILTIIGGILFVSQWGGVRFAVSLTAFLFVLYAALAWAALSFARVWLPLAQLWTVQIATLLLFMRYRAIDEEEQLRQLSNLTGLKLQHRFFSVDAASSEEQWSQVITMVNQTLNLDRVIFLARVKGDHRVHEVISLNCGLDDLKELRRDYERTPYSTAIAEGGPIQVTHFLAHADDGEMQYLIPLLFYGDVLGFWAFAARPEKLSALPNLDAVLRNFAGQIAELLFHHQQTLEKNVRLRNPLQRYLRLQGGEQLAAPLKKAMATLDHRLAGVENYLDGLHTASILYDLFGRVLIANKKIVQLLSDAHLKPYQMTATDLISAAGGVDLDHARRLMRLVILERQKISLPTTLGGGARRFVLHLAPLLPSADKQDLSERAPLPFEVEGVLCELIDVTLFERGSGLKEKVVERLVYQFRNDTVSLLFAISLLEESDLQADKRGRVSRIVREKIDDLMALTEQACGLLTQEVGAAAIVDIYPIDCIQPLMAALEGMREKAAAHGVRFDLELPELISLVFASPGKLQDVLESMVELLVADTVEQGSVNVMLEERAGWIIYRFVNQGFGIPQDSFDAYLHGEAELATEAFRKLRVSAAMAGLWGGELDGHSELGVGTSLELKLKGFFK